MDRKEIFQNVDSSLHFAEAKNLALLTIDTMFVFYSLNLYDKFITLPSYTTAHTVFLFFIILSLLNTLYSFIPVKKKMKNRLASNIIFWYDISKHSDPSSYSQLLNKEINNIDSHLEEEIFSIAKIARRKFRKFKQSLIITIIGVLVIVLYSIYIFITKYFIYEKLTNCHLVDSFNCFSIILQ